MNTYIEWERIQKETVKHPERMKTKMTHISQKQPKKCYGTKNYIE